MLKSNLYYELRARKQDKGMLRVGLVLLVVGVVVFGFSLAYGIALIG